MNAPARSDAAAASIAVIVPVLNEAAAIGALLADLKRHDFAARIVVDGGSDDGTAEIAAASAGIELVRTVRGRGRQLNEGAAQARSDVLLFLHADTRLPADACPRIRNALRRPDVVGGCFRLSFDAEHAVLRLYARMSAIDSVFTTFGDQAFFMRAAAFRDAGAFPDWPFLEDVEMRRRLKRLGKFVKLDAAVVTSARRFQAGGVLRQQAKNGLILCAFLAGVPAERLARFYPAARKTK